MTSPARAASPPLRHWALLPGLAAESLAAVRVRIYRPLRTTGSGDLPAVAVRTGWTAEPGAGRVLRRELYQAGRRCVEEHWWRAGDVPGELIPAHGGYAASYRVVRPQRQDLLAGELAATVIFPDDQRTAGSIAWLATAVSVALRGERRQVAAVAARFWDAPVDPARGRVRVAGGTEGRIWVDVQTADSLPVLLAAVWFGCGPSGLSRPG